MSQQSKVEDRELERQARRMTAPGSRFAFVGALIAGVGVVLIVVGSGFAFGIGVALVAIGGGPAVVGAALMFAGAVSRWAARRRLFA